MKYFKKYGMHLNNDEDRMVWVWIKAGTQLAFEIKFPNFNSTQKGLSQDWIQHLGYMYHCHYMMHHDTNMMGQFYVNPAS